MTSGKQKKILILSGIPHMIDVVQTAKKMGLYTIVTDHAPGSPAKAFADKSYDVSTADLQKLAAIARSEGVDGVFNAFDDVNTFHALALCNELGLPHYATKKQLEICSNKDQFKAHCRQYGVPVTEEYLLGKEWSGEDIADLKFPVIVKPVDSYASQGITICYSKEELQNGYTKALDYSKSGKVIVERFLRNPYDIMMYYTVQDGEVFLSGVTDRYTHQQFKEYPPLPVGIIFPSQHREHYVRTLDPKVRNMIRGLGIQNGLIFIQSLYDNGSAYIYEMGFRISGAQHYIILEKETGVNLLEMMLDFAVGGDLGKYDVSKYDDSLLPLPACNMPLLLDNGTIREIIGLDKVLRMPQVISAVVNKKAGDLIVHTGSYAPMFGRFHIVCETLTELHRTIDAIFNTLKIVSDEGKEMTLARFNPAEAITSK